MHLPPPCAGSARPASLSTACTGFHRLPQKEKRNKKEREKPTTAAYILCYVTITLRVTFLNCLIGFSLKSWEDTGDISIEGRGLSEFLLACVTALKQCAPAGC